MNIHHTTPAVKRAMRMAAAAFLIMAGAISGRAQQRQTTGGGGGFGGFGGGGTANRSSSSSSSSGSSSGSYPSSTSSGEATIDIDPETHSLIVMSSDETYTNILSVVRGLDKPKPQVLIKVVFLEVQHDDTLDLGVEGSFNHNFNPASGITNLNVGNFFNLNQAGTSAETIGQVAGPAAGGAGIYSVLGSDFSATIRAIASAQKTEVLSRPSIMVRNNQPATITVGQSVPLVTGVTYPSLTGGPVSTITYQNVGIILQVTPFISDNGLVEMIVSPQISSLSSTMVQIATNLAVPVIDLRSANTVVVAPDGQTVIIGGLMETDKALIDSKIPFLGDIPLLGNLFKRKQTAKTKKELLIFLTPHIVITPTQTAMMNEQMHPKDDLSQKAFSNEELDKFLDRIPTKSNMTWKAETQGPHR